MIKSVSFDFWGTLATPNPHYSIAQAHLAKEFDPNITPENWLSRKKMIKASVEKESIIDTSQKSLLRAYQTLLPNNSIADIYEFVKFSNLLFRKYPPIPVRGAHEILSTLKSNGVVCYVSSNTFFISGAHLSRFIFDEFEITPLNCKFSDQTGYNKPSEKMFDFTIKPTFHVGDTDETDGACENHGITFLKVDRKRTLYSLKAKIYETFKKQ